MKYFRILSLALLTAAISNPVQATTIRRVFNHQNWLDQKLSMESQSADAHWLAGKKHWNEKRHELLKEWLIRLDQFQAIGETDRMILSHDLTELEWYLLTENVPENYGKDCKNGKIELQGNSICLFKPHLNRGKDFEVLFEKINDAAKEMGLVFTLPTQQEVFLSVVNAPGTQKLGEDKEGTNSFFQFLSSYHPQPELIGTGSSTQATDYDNHNFHLKFGHTYFFHHLRNKGHQHYSYGNYLNDAKIPANLVPVDELVGPYVIQEFPNQYGMKDGLGLWALHMTSHIRVDEKSEFYGREKDSTHFTLSADFYVSLVNPFSFPNGSLHLLKKPKSSFIGFGIEDEINLEKEAELSSLRLVRENLKKN